MTWAISRVATVTLSVAALIGCRSNAPKADGPSVVNGLKSAAAFASIEDNAARSAALFNEAARVLSHPRCANCHPGDSRPRQRDFQPHVPPVWGGADGRGVPALRCTSCHQPQNFEPLSMPGAPDWHVAPPSMVFIGQSPAAICRRLKDNDQNGGKTIAEVVHHVGHDALVAWGFAPGPDREPPPGNQKTLAGLFEAWAAAGAACPPEQSP